MGFLDIIRPCINVKSIKVSAAMIEEKNADKSWITKMWRIKQSVLIDEYNKHQFRIAFDKQVTKWGASPVSNESFIISRM